jgi:prevent-host-death family protein
MTKVSITELKARLSAFLEIVRQGDEVLVTDRGRVIARLSPVGADLLSESRRDLLITSGRIQPPAATLPSDFWEAPRPRDPDGLSLAVLLSDRSEGW